MHTDAQSAKKDVISTKPQKGRASRGPKKKEKKKKRKKACGVGPLSPFPINNEGFRKKASHPLLAR